MHHVKRCFVVIPLLLFLNHATAQFGFRVKYNLNTLPELNQYYMDATNSFVKNLFPTTIELGLDYQYKMKHHRVDFLHEIAFGLNTKSTIGSSRFEFSYLAYNLNTQIYVFDLDRDYETSATSEQKPALKKGFFLAFVPGIIRTRIKGSNGLAIGTTTDQIDLRVGIGAGYDIHIGNLFTITPGIHYNVSQGLDYKYLPVFNGLEPEYPVTNINQVQFQIRFGF